MSKYKIDARLPNGVLYECDTIGDGLRCNNVIAVEKYEEGNQSGFLVSEQCDNYYDVLLTKEQLLAWAEELRELANS